MLSVNTPIHRLMLLNFGLLAGVLLGRSAYSDLYAVSLSVIGFILVIGSAAWWLLGRIPASATPTNPTN